jgi:hypothetical protein
MCPLSLLMDILLCVVGGLLPPQKGILHQPQPQRQSYGEACQGGQRNPWCSQEGKEEDHVKIRPASPTLTLADATRAFMLEGPRKKSKKKVTAGELARDEFAFDAFAEFETPESGAEASLATS